MLLPQWAQKTQAHVSGMSPAQFQKAELPPKVRTQVCCPGGLGGKVHHSNGSRWQRIEPERFFSNLKNLMEFVVLGFWLAWDPNPFISSNFSLLECECPPYVYPIIVYWKQVTCLISKVHSWRGISPQGDTMTMTVVMTVTVAKKIVNRSSHSWRPVRALNNG